MDFRYGWNTNLGVWGRLKFKKYIFFINISLLGQMYVWNMDSLTENILLGEMKYIGYTAVVHNMIQPSHPIVNVVWVNPIHIFGAAFSTMNMHIILQ